MTIKIVKLMTLLTAVCVLSGCSLFAEQITREEEFTFGSVKFLDTRSSRNLRIVHETTERGKDGRLEVKIKWNNIGDRPFKAKMRRIFIDEQGNRERGAYMWDVQTFPPGDITLSWKSYSVSAVHYKIHIREAE